MARNRESYRRHGIERGKQSRRLVLSVAGGTPISSTRDALSTQRSRRRQRTAVRQFANRWYSPGMGPANEDKVYISSAELRTLISAQLATMLDRNCVIKLADAEYYCTPLDDALDIIARSQTDRRTWVEDVFDCDDFAHILKSIFAEAAYKEGQRRKPHCFGIVWGRIGGESHAFNWTVNSDMTLRLVEPQSDEIFLPGPQVANIDFMLG